MTGMIMSIALNMAAPGFGMLMNPWVQEEIGLTSEQAEKISQIMADHIKSTASLRADMIARRFELRAELGKDKPDMKKVEKLAGEIGNLQAKMITERIRAEIAVRGLLTDEQKAKLEELRASRPGKGGTGWFGKGKGKGGKGPRPMWF